MLRALETYADVVEENYHHLADILLSSASDASKVAQLLGLDFLSVPTVKRGYVIWSEGIWAETLACFPTAAFPRLVQALRSSPGDERLSLLCKALTMWGDHFADALSPWLDEGDAQLQGRAIRGLTLYAKALHTFCNAETPSIEQQLYRDQNSELPRLMRDREIGVAPPAALSGTPRLRLSQQLSHLLTHASDESQHIAILRCLGQLHHPKLALPEIAEHVAHVATHAPSRAVEREAVVALCHLNREQASAHMRTHWLHNAPERSMAAEILGFIRTASAFEMLQELLTDANAETRRKAISSLEAFASVQALEVLDALEERDQKAHRQLLRSRSQLKRRLQRKGVPVRKRHNALYSISPLALLLQTPTTPIFSERELNASIAPDLIADVSSSRRYAVELGLLERHADVYRLSGMGTAVHWVETYLQEGLSRFAASV